MIAFFYFFKCSLFLSTGSAEVLLSILLHTSAFPVIDGALPETADSNSKVTGSSSWREAVPFSPQLLQCNWWQQGTGCSIMLL